MEDQLAARGGGIDRLLQTPEPDAPLGQAGDRVDQMPLIAKLLVGPGGCWPLPGGTPLRALGREVLPRVTGRLRDNDPNDDDRSGQSQGAGA
jgi:hypothetical protein